MSQFNDFQYCEKQRKGDILFKKGGRIHSTNHLGHWESRKKRNDKMEKKEEKKKKKVELCDFNDGNPLSLSILFVLNGTHTI